MQFLSTSRLVQKTNVRCLDEYVIRVDLTEFHIFSAGIIFLQLQSLWLTSEAVQNKVKTAYVISIPIFFRRDTVPAATQRVS